MIYLTDTRSCAFYDKAMKYTRMSTVFFVVVVLYSIQMLLFLFRITLPELLWSNTTLISLPALLPLRAVLAFIFLWYAYEHICSGTQFSSIIQRCLQKMGRPTAATYTRLAFYFGIVEVLIAFSFIQGFYIDLFSLVAVCLLGGIIAVYYISLSTVLSHTIVFFGATLSLFLLTLTSRYY